MTGPKDNLPEPAGGELVLNSAPGGDVCIECLLRDETVWLTQQQIGDLFGGKDI